MNRDEWNFSYTADKLHDAAKAKHAHHATRLAWWEAKKAEVIDKVKAEGIEVDESVADMVSNSYQRGATVQVRNDLVRDLQECVAKIREHREKVENYDGWAQVLASQARATLNLHHDDWLFFFRTA